MYSVRSESESDKLGIRLSLGGAQHGTQWGLCAEMKARLRLPGESNGH